MTCAWPPPPPPGWSHEGGRRGERGILSESLVSFFPVCPDRFAARCVRRVWWQLPLGCLSRIIEQGWDDLVDHAAGGR